MRKGGMLSYVMHVKWSSKFLTWYLACRMIFHWRIFTLEVYWCFTDSLYYNVLLHAWIPLVSNSRNWCRTSIWLRICVYSGIFIKKSASMRNDKSRYLISFFKVCVYQKILKTLAWISIHFYALSKIYLL